MTDSEVRRLEREFRHSGTVEAETAWLRARVQAGEVEQGQLELAAYCGHLASAAALGDNAAKRDSAEQIAEEIGRWGKEARVRTFIAATHRAAGLGIQPQPVTREFGDPDPVVPALVAAERWVICPCKECQDLCYWAGDAAGIQGAASRKEDPRWSALAVVASATAYLASEEPERLEAGVVSFASGFRAVRRLLDESSLLKAIGEEISAWALGYGDPVRERVEVRQQGAGP